MFELIFNICILSVVFVIPIAIIHAIYEAICDD